MYTWMFCWRLAVSRAARKWVQTADADTCFACCVGFNGWDREKPAPQRFQTWQIQRKAGLPQQSICRGRHQRDVQVVANKQVWQQLGNTRTAPKWSGQGIQEKSPMRLWGADSGTASAPGPTSRSPLPPCKRRDEHGFSRLFAAFALGLLTWSHTARHLLQPSSIACGFSRHLLAELLDSGTFGLWDQHAPTAPFRFWADWTHSHIHHCQSETQAACTRCSKRGFKPLATSPTFS